MRILLDTHVFLWAVTNDPKLSQTAQRLILDAEEVFISAASIWEISIKAGLDKIEVDVDELIAEITAAGFSELPVTNTHAAAVRHLPNHHRDPFDRLLIAQAITEPLRLLSADEHVWKYSDLVIRV
ncbi:type II toxin-antitoxin system VapC family toxin [Cupriavidus necator]|uniref:PilT protein, N-terminal n=1 Tax=Cupriavidus pinatubonensis (strain JMP 134 / LMG 1197) TaxID=264198 RepID=Q46MI3_CUPPJ|nr:type II toxin-antitoxin system VapC family toxin [Cupriavidus necator]